MSIEPNDIISDANDSGVSSSGTRSTILNGSISPNNDVDLYQFQANSGEGILLDVDSAEFNSGLDSILRLFDANGNELAVSDDTPAPGEPFTVDSYIGFQTNTTGDYFVGVSSFANFSYDPINGGSSGDSGGSSGDYDLEISLVEVVADDDPDNTIAEAVDSGVSSSGQNTTVIEDSISPQGDVDVFEIQLAEGDTLALNINAAQLDTELDPILRLFDANGNELAVSDDSPAPGEPFTLDSFLEFTASNTDQYFVGVSGFANFDYDVVNGRTNIDPVDNFSSVGDYELVINAFNNIEGTDRGDVLLGNSRNNSIRGLNGNDIITGLGQNDNLVGDGGNDIITGNNGDDTLIGGDGADQLFGNAGADVLQGDAGADSLFGGGGADIFVITETSEAADTIFDFRDGSDKILLQNGSSFFDVTLESIDGGSGTSISVFGNNIANLTAVNISAISEDDFVL